MSANTTAPARIINQFPLSVPTNALSALELDNTHPATRPQVVLLADLLGELKEFELGRARAMWRALATASHQGELTFPVARFLINRTISELRSHREIRKALDNKVETPKIPDGRYALRGDDGVVKFYRLATSKRRHQNVFVYASDTQHMLPLGAHLGIKRQIEAAGIEASGVLFGVESRTCRHCGRRLTDTPAAIAHNGYGPDCFNKYGSRG